MSERDDTLDASLTPDEAFDLLRDGTRRRAVSALRESGDTMALTELAAETVARWEGEPTEEVSTARREQIATSLHHCHLPKLADACVVEYDHVANQVAVTKAVEELAPYFELLETEGTSGSRRD